jgi:hypothetical protein
MSDEIVGPVASLGFFGDRKADFAANIINNGKPNTFINSDRGELHTTPLIMLIKSENVETSAIGTALEMRCDPNQQEYWNSEKNKNYLKETPVYAALDNGRADVLLLLLEAKAQVKDVQDKLKTCIYREQSAQCVKILMEKCNGIPTSEHIALVNERYNCGSPQSSRRNQQLYAMYKLFTNARPILLKVDVDRMMSRRISERSLPIAIKNPNAVEDTRINNTFMCSICHIRNKVVMSNICHHLTLCLHCAKQESSCPICQLDAIEWLVITL